MAATYSVTLYDPFGTPLADISNFTKLSYTRVVNDWSTLTLTLPPGFDLSLIRIPDGRIVVWRNGQLETGTVWLIRVLRPVRDEAGNVTIEVEADTPLAILREPGRVGWIHASQAIPDLLGVTASYAITVLWQYTAGGAAGAVDIGVNRDISSYITFASSPGGDTSLIYRTPDNREILAVMRDVANDATQQGVYVAFDIVASAPDALQFQTFLGQRGVDHRFPSGQNPVIFSGDMGNVGACSLELNYRDEITVAYAAGSNDRRGNPSGSGNDLERVQASPFGLRETYMTDTHAKTIEEFNGICRAIVRGGRPYAVLSGKILDTPQARYGVHWGWGDYVTISEFGYTLDCRIDAISVTVDDTDSGQFETIDASFRAETAI